MNAVVLCSASRHQNKLEVLRLSAKVQQFEG